MRQKLAASNKDWPFAAALIDDEGNVVCITHNSQESLNDRTAHAEVLLIKEAAVKLGIKYSFGNYSVVSNSEPCSMCMSLLIKSKIKNLYYGAPLDVGNDPYIRAKDLVKKAKHKIKVVGGILESECMEIISNSRNYNFGNDKIVL